MRQRLLHLNIFWVLLIGVAASCTGDYTFDNVPYTSSPVVISMITPDSTISVSLFQSRPPASSSAAVGVDGATIIVKEDGVIVTQGITKDGVFRSSYKPLERKSYELIVKIQDQPTISAITTIPASPAVQLSIREKTNTNEHPEEGYILADVTSLEPSNDTRAIWIAADAINDLGTSNLSTTGEYYSNNNFVDQINASIDPKDVLLRESNVIFERNFIRIERSRIQLALPLTFSFGVFWLSEKRPDSDDYTLPWIKTYATEAVFYFLAASKEYDRFNRSVERQRQNNISESLIRSPGSIQSNIKNGLGIFGGYSVSAIKIRIKNPIKDV